MCFFLKLDWGGGGGRGGGVSPVIAMLLLIVVAVAGSLIVYFWFTGYAGETVTGAESEELRQALKIEGSRREGDTLVLYVRNIGLDDVTVDKVYVERGGITVAALDVEGGSVQIEPGEVAEVRVEIPATLQDGTYTLKIGGTSGVAASYRYVSGVAGGGGVNWLTGWNYRRTITITENSGNTLTNYQIKIVLTTTNFDYSHANSDGSDIRFTDSDGTTQLSYWIESWNPSGTSIIWVKVPEIPANSEKKIYIYYGNPSAQSESNVINTFIRVINGLIGSWHFDEGTGNTAHDTSGYNNHALLTTDNPNYPPPTWTENGRYSNAVYFDGTEWAKVDAGNANIFNPTSGLSIEAWINASSLYSTSWGPMIVTKYGGNWKGYALFLDNGGYPSFMVADGSVWYPAQSSKAISTGVWYHIVGTWDGSIVRIYVNTVLKASTFGTLTNDPNQDLTIGRASWDPVGGMFKGTIDEVRIYNRSLTQEEINDLYNYYGYTTPNYLGKVLIRKYTYPEPTVIIGEEEY
ncbi:MAG: hypothetical protein DRZ80_02395 [Thermoprotei archaeon]|nr:MAG: hypothetical protein DRZ80_02395 [Thermoprotei archaeon]